jgi:adenine-specific DNA glycosylase
MELGALVCTARIAHCDRCPVRSVCRSAKPSVREPT